MTFPCDYALKAMGLAEPGFDALIVELVQRHGPAVREGAVSSRPSKNGKYVSVTVGFRVESRAQLDAIYDTLTAHEKVLMRL
jgi:putative lipoic acid-binding regulatory protein